MTTSLAWPAQQSAETAFARVLGEWQLLRPSRAAVGAWDRAFDRISAEERALRTGGAWVHGRDDLLGIFGAQRAEVKHSAILAWLLDPCAKHGLGTRFLAAFTTHAFPLDELKALESARTMCEVVRGPCRADIVIELLSATIIIENKIDASESERQCDVLFDHFGEVRGARFVLLTPRGTRPETATGDAANAFACVSYDDVRRLLASVLSTASGSARPGRRVAEGYLRTLEQEFP